MAGAGLSLLRFLGRHARWALPAGVFVGIVVPPLASLMRPLVTAAVIGTITGALLRLDWQGLAAQVRRPAVLVALLLWQLVVSPLAVWLGGSLAGVPPDFALLLVLQAAAPPIASSVVFAMILGLDGSFALLGAVGATLLLPLTLTPLVGLLLPGAGIEVDLAAFFVRVTTIVAAPFLIAWALRRWVGPARLARNDDLLAGTNVVMMVIFAIAVMDGVTARLASDPAFIGLLLAAAFGAGLLLHLAGYALFRRAGHSVAWSAALLSGNRNMGLMLAVTAGTAGPAFSLYVGIAQIPMYFAPLLLGPFVEWSLRKR